MPLIPSRFPAALTFYIPGLRPRRFFSDSLNGVHPAGPYRRLITRNSRKIVRICLLKP